MPQTQTGPWHRTVRLQRVRTTLLENHKAKGFLSNTGPDPLKNHNATKPAFNMSHHRLPSETPLQWHFAGVKMSGFDCIDS